MNLASYCVLTIIEDVSGDAKGSVSILLSLLYVTHALNQSPNLSPIKHVLDMVRRRLRLPGNVDDLARQLKQIWQEIPQETIRVLYYSMPRCVAACIQARDESTPY
ncbi:transposable element Tcb1 transposase [Trichonephila clavipes]|nr:transposable element Tcb1 transposase [Trichonephila clavipes]